MMLIGNTRKPGGVWSKAIAVKDADSFDGPVAKDTSYYKLIRLP